MSEQQHKALELADAIRYFAESVEYECYVDDIYAASAELRRLHAENEALRKQMEAQKDAWLSWHAKRDALEKDAARWREWLKGNALTVVVPTPTEKNPASKTTIVYAPSPYANFASAMSAAIDAARRAGGEG